MLQNLTLAINFIALLAALWLGLYLVTHGSHRPAAWLFALAFWSASGYFLNQLLTLYPPSAPPPETRAWLIHLMLFWPRDVFEMGWKGWLLGWLPSYSVIFGYHATLYMLPGPFTRRRLLGALAGYAVALAGILVKVNTRDLWLNLLSDPLYNIPFTYPFFPLFAIGFVTFAGLSEFNLARTRRSSPASLPRPQFWLFTSAILLAGVTGLLGILAALLNIPVPQALTAFLILLALLLAGAGAAGYNALPDLRSLPRSLLSSAAGAAAILAICLLLLRFITGLYPLPAIEYVLAGCPAIILHSLIYVTRQQLHHPLFFKENHLPTPGAPDANVVFPEGLEKPARSEDIPMRAVELALRNLHNYAYLSESPLSGLHLVVRRLECLENGTDTHMDRGKAVSEVLSEAVLRLRPSQEDMPEPPPREWYPYIILREAYLEDRPNLEIMSRLYISEGTFNRTRKSAIGSVARLLMEMEAYT